MYRVVLILLFCYSLNGVAHGQCPASEVKCMNSTSCIRRDFVCDLIWDCPDRSDEENCSFQGSGCGSPVYQNGAGGSFTSMNYPQPYTGSAFCKWLIEVPIGQTVKLQFDTLFDLEEPRRGECTSDSVTVYQDDPQFQIIGRYCGQTAPPEMAIGSRRVVVYFRTDQERFGRGFKVQWTAIGPANPSQPRDVQCGQVVKLRGQQGSIDSPFLTDVTAGSSAIDCRWQIQVESNYFVQLTFESFFLGQPCEDARLDIFDGPDSNGRLLLSTCGDSPPESVTASSNYLYVAMTIRDEVRNNRWFRAIYSQTLTTTSSPSGCDGVSGTISSQAGWISSPNFDGVTPYKRNLDCQWNFQAADNMFYEFSFTSFAIELSSDCNRDYLRISEAKPKTENNVMVSKELKTLCGIDLPFDVTSSSSNVTFNFHTDDITQYAGFNVTYVMKQKPNDCGDNWFRCRCGMCVQRSVVCDGKRDCMDGSEEIVCANKPSCGIAPIQSRPSTGRIVGGQVAVRGSWPWAVSLLGPDGEHFCAGTLIDLQWVLTAAHCFVKVTSRAYTGYSVVAGRYQLRVVDRREQHRSFHQVFVPANFNRRTFEDDIALVRLSNAFQKTDYVSAVCLPRGPVNTTFGTIIGWGETRNASCCQGRLKQGTVLLFPQSVCRQPDYYGDRILDHMMCAGWANGNTDSCDGDSGGPLVVGQTRPTGAISWEVHGVTSSGNACAVPKKPGIYTRVWDYMRWIEETIATGINIPSVS